MLKTVLKVVAGLVLLVVLGVVGLVLTLRHPMPEAAPSAEGDALAQKVLTAVAAQHWAKTGAVTWTFSGRNTHLWDRQRGLVRVTFANGTVVLLDEARTRSWARDVSGAMVTSPVLAENAWKSWVNDAFWMMGPAKLMDPGTTRAVVALPDGGQGLLVRYASGGATPGDSYLWMFGPDGTPTAWRMWVSVLPIPGLLATWEDWITLDTGVRVARQHVLGNGLARPAVTNLRAAATLAQLVPGEDPFAALLAQQDVEPTRVEQPQSAPSNAPP
jgi:hypothetical protein